MLDLKHQDFLYRPGPYWERHACFAAHEMERRGILAFRSEQSGLIGQSYTDAPIYDPTEPWKMGNLPRRIIKSLVDTRPFRRYILRAYDDVIRSAYLGMSVLQDEIIQEKIVPWIISSDLLERIPESTVGGCVPERTVVINGNKVSKNYVELLCRIKNFSSFVDFSQARCVFEIGGGFGSCAHLLLHLYPNIKKYLYLDVPPMLYVGTQYLKHFFPNRVLDYLQTRDRQKITFSGGDDIEILAIPPWQIEQMDAQIDVFVNSCSMQEIPMPAIENYVRHISRLAAPTIRICLVTYEMLHADGVRVSDEQLLGAFRKHYQVEKIPLQCSYPQGIPLNYYFGK